MPSSSHPACNFHCTGRQEEDAKKLAGFLAWGLAAPDALRIESEMVAMELALPDAFVASHKNIRERQQQGAVAAPDHPYKTKVDMPILKKGTWWFPPSFGVIALLAITL